MKQTPTYNTEVTLNPKPVSIESPKVILDGEVKVKVCSSLGSYCGGFVWPKKDTNILENLNEQIGGYVFHIE